MDQKNLIVAIVLSLGILLGFQYFYEMPRMKAQQATREAEQAAQMAQRQAQGLPPGTSADLPPIPGQAAPLPAGADRPTLIARSPRVRIDSPRLTGSIALEGGRIDDVTLKNYRETVDPASPMITLLNPAGARDAYYGEFGWVPEGQGVAVPDATTRWTASGDVLGVDRPLTLTWDNGQGLRFSREFKLDQNFMISVQQRVENTGATPVTLFPYALISRSGTPQTQGFYILHEGMIAVLNGRLREYKYDDLKGETSKTEPTTGGWLGITDKYWLVALVPDQREEVKTRFNHTMRDQLDRYQVDYLGNGRVLAPGGTASSQHQLFVGAKEVTLLDRYRDQQGIDRFDFAVDWGWFFFLTKPIFLALDWLYRQIGNFGIAILLLTVVIKLLFFPLANRSYVMMSKMKKLAPELTKLREQYGDDRQKMNQGMMAIYKKEKVNPLSGCLPIVLQIPVFFALYKVLFVTIEMRHAPFYGWIRDLSAPDPTTIFNLFGLIPWEPPHILMLGAWPLIMGVTMFLQQKLNPQPADPVQAKVFMFMPIIFTVMLASFPAGLVIYWAWNNLLSIAQQWTIMKRMGVKA